MRVPLHSDMLAVARVLRERPHDMRSWLLCRLISEAISAEAWVRREGECHPAWGDGALASAAFRRGVPAQYSLGDRDYCLCLAQVAETLANLSRRTGTSEQ